MDVSQAVWLPEASACAVCDSVSGPVSGPSCPGLDFHPPMSSFTVYTNNSIYKEITPVKRKKEQEKKKLNLVFSCKKSLKSLQKMWSLWYIGLTENE